MKREVSPLKKHIEESPKIRALKERRKKARKRWAALFCILVLALVVGFVFAARHPELQIVQVTVEGNRVIDAKDVIAIADADLSGMYAYVIPRRNAFFYPKKQITADIQRAFPRFNSLEIYRIDLHSIHIQVSEVRGSALWCGADTSNISNDLPCWFTDGAGKLVSEAPQYSGNVYLRFFGGTIDQADMQVLGKSFIEPEAFLKLVAFGEKLSLLGFNVKALVIGPEAENKFVIDVGHGDTAMIPFLKADDYSLLAANLAAALSKSELAAKLKADKAHLEYFDLRYANKVYYKFSDDQ